MKYLIGRVLLICLVAAPSMTPLDLYAQPPNGAWAQPAPSPGPPLPPIPPEFEDKTVPVKRVSPGVFRIGEIEINKPNKTVSFPAAVNMDRGLLEYLLVRAGGKTHESLFRTMVRPYDLQLAFLLLGFEGSDSPLRFQGDPEKPKGEPVTITVSYTQANGRSTTINPEDWIVKMVEDKPRGIKRLDWVFTGSTVTNGRFMAQFEGSIIALYHDPIAMIDNISEGGESDKVWFVKEGTPPIGTPVTLTVKGKK